MKIAIDAMGGDDAPQVVVEGVKTALQEFSEIELLYLVGDQAQISPLVEQYGLPKERIEIVHTDEVVEMHESGAKMLRKKKKSSITLATDLVKRGLAEVVIGAGNTGAAVANATVKLRTLEGVAKAAIAASMPNENGTCMLMDAGANPDPKPENIVESGFMGAIYASSCSGLTKKPKVGIMSNGEEEEKGTAFTKEAHALMKEVVASGKDLPFEYVGYVEGRDIFLSDLQVCLTDGFTGNVILKTAEGVAKGMSGWIKAEYKKTPFRMLAGLLSKKVFKSVKDRTSHERVGGSLLLGVNGICVIAHGSSSAYAIHNAIDLGVRSVKAMQTLHSVTQ